MDFNTLQQNLMQAKKVMNKVDGIPNGTILKPPHLVDYQYL